MIEWLNAHNNKVTMYYPIPLLPDQCNMKENGNHQNQEAKEKEEKWDHRLHVPMQLLPSPAVEAFPLSTTTILYESEWWSVFSQQQHQETREDKISRSLAAAAGHKAPRSGKRDSVCCDVSKRAILPADASSHWYSRNVGSLSVEFDFFNLLTPQTSLHHHFSLIFFWFG